MRNIGLLLSRFSGAIERGFERDRKIAEATHSLAARLKRGQRTPTPEYTEGLFIGAVFGILGGIFCGYLMWGPHP